MIHFFKRIRLSLINQEKFGKYSLYAFGEIIIVVFGIMIALQLNNWNAERKQAERIHESLVSLKEEIKYNKDFLEYLTISRRQMEQDVTSYIHLISDINKPLSERASLELPSFQSRKLNPRNSVANSIENTGLINSIKNDSLKKLLIIVRGDYLNLSGREENFFEKLDDLSAFLNKKYHRGLVDSNNHDDWITTYPENVEDNLYAERVEFIEKTEYYNLLSGCAVALHVQVIVGNGLLHRFELILEELNREIAKID